MNHHVWKTNVPLQLESGTFLNALEIAYSTYGELNEEKDNVIFVCHALTANSQVAEWWPGMVGDRLIFDPQRYFIVCANILGSCYGSTGPSTIETSTGKALGDAFPLITIRDLVKAQQLLAQHLDINKILLLCGGSMGGQQALEWATQEPSRIINLFLIATNARHSAWGIAFNEAQRMAMEGGNLAAARAIAMLSYRNYNMYAASQTDEEAKLDNYKAASYQRYQGEKLAKRFDVHCYKTLSKAMDTHHLGRGRISIENALQKISANALIMGISSDLLFPISEQQFIAKNMANARFEEIDSPYGHDGFLIETEKITTALKQHFQL